MRETTESPFTLPKRYLNGKLGVYYSHGCILGQSQDLRSDGNYTTSPLTVGDYNEREQSENQTKIPFNCLGKRKHFKFQF